MAATDLDAETVRCLLDYDTESGKLWWKPRSVEWFASPKSCKTWNTRYSGQEALISRMNGYARGDILGVDVLAHRVIWLIMTGRWPNVIDHINGVRDDNRWRNLRSVTNRENTMNCARSKGNTSGITGVFQCKKSGSWVSYIKVNGRNISLGSFRTIEEAAVARGDANRKYGFHPHHGTDRNG